MKQIKKMLEKASQEVASFLETSVEDISIDFRENYSGRTSQLSPCQNPISSYHFDEDNPRGIILVSKGIEYLAILHEVFHLYHARKNPGVVEFDMNADKTGRELHEVSKMVGKNYDISKLPEGMSKEQIEKKYLELVTRFVENLIVQNVGLERVAHAGTTFFTQPRSYQRFLGNTELGEHPSEQKRKLLQDLIKSLSDQEHFGHLKIPNLEEIGAGITNFEGDTRGYLQSLVHRAYCIGELEGIKTPFETGMTPQVELSQGYLNNDPNLHYFLLRFKYPRLSDFESKRRFLELFYRDPIEITQQTLNEHQKEDKLIVDLLKRYIDNIL